MTEHEVLKEKALEAIRDLHEDDSVDLETTLSDLEDLAEELDLLMDLIAGDIERRDG